MQLNSDFFFTKSPHEYKTKDGVYIPSVSEIACGRSDIRTDSMNFGEFIHYEISQILSGKLAKADANQTTVDILTNMVAKGIAPKLGKYSEYIVARDIQGVGLLAGTLDLVGLDSQGECIVDFKTDFDLDLIKDYRVKLTGYSLLTGIREAYLIGTSKVLHYKITNKDILNFLKLLKAFYQDRLVRGMVDFDLSQPQEELVHEIARLRREKNTTNEALEARHKILQGRLERLLKSESIATHPAITISYQQESDKTILNPQGKKLIEAYEATLLKDPENVEIKHTSAHYSYRLKVRKLI